MLLMRLLWGRRRPAACVQLGYEIMPWSRRESGRRVREIYGDDEIGMRICAKFVMPISIA